MEMDIKNLLGKRIKELRKTQSLTQEKLSEKIGIDTVSLCNIERGKYFPSADTLDRIIEALQIKPSELFECEHLQDTNILISEINNILLLHPERVSEFYKILTAMIK